MSYTYNLVCHDTKQQIWIGQGRGAFTSFYSGEAETMKRLGRFLIATKGHSLVVMCDDTEEGEWQDYDEFEEPNK